MVTDTDYLVSYDGRNDTGPYAIDFDVQVDAGGNAIDIKVYLVDADGVQSEITDDCTITGLNVYTTESYDDTYTVIIVRDPDPTQPYALPYGSKLPSKTIENALDRLAFLIQKVLIQVDRSLRFPLSEAAVGDLPTVAELTGKVLGLDAEGAFAAYAGVPSVPATAAAATVLDDATVDDMLTTLGLSAFIKTLIDDENAATARATLGVTLTNLGLSAFIQTLVDDADAATARSTLAAAADAEVVKLAGTQTITGQKYAEYGMPAEAKTEISGTWDTGTWTDLLDIATDLPAEGSFLVEVRGLFGTRVGTGPGQHVDGSAGTSSGLFLAQRFTYGMAGASAHEALVLLSETNSGTGVDLQVSGTKIQAKHGAGTSKAAEFEVTITTLGRGGFAAF